MVHPQFWCSRLRRRARVRPFWSGGVEDTTAQQVELGATIHVALDRLEPVDLTLDGTVAPGQRQGRPHGIDVLQQAPGEATQARGLSRIQPWVERGRVALAHEPGEAVGEVCREADVGGAGG